MQLPPLTIPPNLSIPPLAIQHAALKAGVGTGLGRSTQYLHVLATLLPIMHSWRVYMLINFCLELVTE